MERGAAPAGAGRRSLRTREALGSPSDPTTGVCRWRGWTRTGRRRAKACRIGAWRCHPVRARKNGAEALTKTPQWSAERRAPCVIGRAAPHQRGTIGCAARRSAPPREGRNARIASSSEVRDAMQEVRRCPRLSKQQGRRSIGLRHSGARTDLGFTRDRHLNLRKSAEADLHARTRNPEANESSSVVHLDSGPAADAASRNDGEERGSAVQQRTVSRCTAPGTRCNKKR